VGDQAPPEKIVEGPRPMRPPGSATYEVRSGIRWHCSPASLLATISRHSPATLPAKMSVFKSHMRQNA